MAERRSLKDFRVCRFCLDDDGPFTNIYEKDSRDGKQQIPLPLQIMACVAIEVFSNDGMPQLICNPCRSQTLGAYNFKSTCKKADDTLKLYLATGNRKLVKPLLKKRAFSKANSSIEHIVDKPQTSTNINKSQKPPPEQTTLNTTHVTKRPTIPSTPPTAPKRPKLTQSDDEHPGTETIHITLETDPLAHQDLIAPSGGGEDILPTAPARSAKDVTRGREYEQRFGEQGNSTEEGDSTEEDEMVERGGRERGMYEEYVDEEERGEMGDKSQQQQPIATNIYPCTICERSFPLIQQLELHMKNHERVRSFSCGHVGCGRMFFNKYDLAKHTQTHFDYKPYSCVVCEKTFARESLLHRHEKVHVNVPKYLCTDCDRAFLNREDYDTHREKHKKRRPFQCRICNKSFVFKQGLERHEVTHADEKPHKCNYCEASFTSPIKLMRHITSHAGLRPYPCKVCGRTFLLSHHLTRHLKGHYGGHSGSGSDTPIGQHKCDVCSMSFRRKDSLINHSAIHSMVNLKCVICNTAFENAKQVKHHITSHLSGLPYPCDKCDYSFDTQDQLEEHELKHAEMEYEEQIEAEVNKEAQEEEEDYDYDEEQMGASPHDNNAAGEQRRSEERQYKVEDLDDGEEANIEEDGEDNDDGEMTEFTITENGLVPVQRNKKQRRRPITQTPMHISTNSPNKPFKPQISTNVMEHVDFDPYDSSEYIAPITTANHQHSPPPLVSAHAQRNDRCMELDTQHVEPQQQQQQHQEEESEVITPHQQEERPTVTEHNTKLMHTDDDDDDNDNKQAVAEEIRNLQKKGDERERLKDIVRTEGTKVYARKSGPAQKFKPQMIQPPAATMAPLSQINQSTLETLGLTQQDVNSMPTKKYMDMKVGDKTVRVQKLIMTKSEIAAMAKQGKIEMKGGNIILKKTKGPLTPPKASESSGKPTRITLENILDQSPKVPVLHKQRIMTKKTYVKKSPAQRISALSGNTDVTITPVILTPTVPRVEVEHIDMSNDDLPPEHSIEEVNI